MRAKKNLNQVKRKKKVKESEPKKLLGSKRRKSVKESDSESNEINKKTVESESEDEEEKKSQMKRSLRVRNKKQKIEKSPSPKKDTFLKEKLKEKEKIVPDRKETKEKEIKSMKESKEKEIKSMKDSKEKEKLNDSMSKSSLVSSVRNAVQPTQPSETREGELSKDVPMRIVMAKQHTSQDDLILCEVEWLPNIQGFKPLNSHYTNHELKRNYASILCDFYESRLAFPKSKKN
jgi:hypothetical protein